MSALLYTEYKLWSSLDSIFSLPKFLQSLIFGYPSHHVQVDSLSSSFVSMMDMLMRGDSELDEVDGRIEQFKESVNERPTVRIAHTQPHH